MFCFACKQEKLLTTQKDTCCNKSFAMLTQKVKINSWLIVKSFRVRKRIKFYKIFKKLVVEYQKVVLITGSEKLWKLQMLFKNND